MKALKMLAVVAALGMVAGFALGQEKEKPKTLDGTVVKVSDDGKVTVKAGEKEVVVSTGEKTKVTVDGKEAKVADLKAGMTVVVTPADGTAEKIEAKTPVKKIG